MLLLDERNDAFQTRFLTRYLVRTDTYIRNHQLICETETSDDIFSSIKNRVYPFSYLVEKSGFSVLRILIHSQTPNRPENKVTDEMLNDYLIHGITTGLIDYHLNSDTVSLSLSGMELLDSYTDNEYRVGDRYLKLYEQALLRNETNVKLLATLYTNEEPLTQFELSYLLFKNNDSDLDSLTQKLLESLITERLQGNPESLLTIGTYIEQLERNDDKYTRTICNWFIHVGLIEETTKTVSLSKCLNVTLPAYKITDKGKNSIVTEAYVPNEYIDMPNLHVSKMIPDVVNDEYVYTLIFKLIEKEKRILGLNEIDDYLKDKGIIFGKKKIKDFVDNFLNKSIFYQDIKTRYKSTSPTTKDLISNYAMKAPDRATEIKNNLMNLGIKENLKLIDYSFNSEYNKEFEDFTWRLLKGNAKLNAKEITQIPGPDSIIDENSIGVIIDNKSSERNFSLTKNYRDQMSSYLTHAN